VPTVLEEGPHQVFEINVGHALVVHVVDRLLQPLEEATRTVELVAITNVARSGLDVSHHN